MSLRDKLKIDAHARHAVRPKGHQVCVPRTLAKMIINISLEAPRYFLTVKSQMILRDLKI